MCYLGFYKMKYKEYYENVKDVLRSEEHMIQEFTKEIYSLVEYSIRFKVKLIRYAGLALTIGLVIGLIFIFI